VAGGDAGDGSDSGAPPDGSARVDGTVGGVDGGAVDASGGALDASGSDARLADGALAVDGAAADMSGGARGSDGGTGGGPPWVAQGSGTTQGLYGVYGAAPDDVYAVGYNGTILHYDGSTWNAETSGTTDYLSGVWVDATGSRVYAVSQQGNIYRSSGNGSWSLEPAYPDQASSFLHAVWGSSASDVYAVGNPGVILHSTGRGWSKQTSPVSGNLNGVWGTGPTDVYVVGEGGTLHSTGDGTWTLYTSGSAWLTAISGNGVDRVVSVGLMGTIFGGPGGDAFAQERSGTIDERLRGVAVLPSDAFAVGDGLLLRSTAGGAWTAETLDASIGKPYLEAAWGSANAGVFAVGLSGAILHR
jgi:hypothetical protein